MIKPSSYRFTKSVRAKIKRLSKITKESQNKVVKDAIDLYFKAIKLKQSIRQ